MQRIRYNMHMQKAEKHIDLNKQINIKLGFAGSYTLLWLLMCFFIFLRNILEQRTNIWIVDGISQHLTALSYYSEYLKEGLSNLFAGNFHLHQWDMAIGEGSDVINTLNYYCIGDPFALISILFPKNLMWVCLVLISLIKFYLSGIIFDLYIRKIKSDIDMLPRVVAALSYAFSFWAIFNVIRHPFFLNPLIFFPLILLGVEKIIKKEKPYLMVIAVVLSAASNVYFFYMMVILTVLYCAVRLIEADKENLFKNLGKIFICSIIGVLISGIIFYPSLMNLLSEGRLGDGAGFKLFYPLVYYRNLLRAVTYSGDYYLCLGFSIPAILASVLVFKTKGRISLKIFISLVVMFSIFPFFGQLFNGFSYVSNRWSFVAAFVFSVALGLMWDKVTNLSKKEKIISISLVSVYLLVYLIVFGLSGRIDISVIVSVILGILFIVFQKTELIKGKKLLASLLLVSVTFTGVYYVYGLGNDDTPIGAPMFFSDRYYGDTEAKLIKDHGHNDTQRYSGSTLTGNVGVYNGISSTQYYWSNNNPYVMEFRNKVGLEEYRLYSYEGYSSDIALLTLSATDIYAKDGDRNPIPYGYVKSYENSYYEIYETQNILPLAYAYENKMSVDEWEKLSLIERRQILLNAAIADEGDFKKAPDNVFVSDVKNIPDNLAGSIDITFDSMDNSEIFIEIKGLKFEDGGNNTQIARIGIHDRDYTFSKTFELFTKENNWYNGREDFAINLGYFKDGINELTLDFGNEGIFTYDSFKIISSSVEGFENKINSLKSEDIKNIVISDDTISMDAKLSKDKFMVFAIPYLEGWSLEVDGKPEELQRANIQYMGADIKEGSHHIELKYENKNLKTGMILSVIGFLSLGVIIFIDKRCKANDK